MAIEYTYMLKSRKARRRTDDTDSNVAAFLRINGLDDVCDVGSIRRKLDDEGACLLIGKHRHIVEIEVTE